jgi:hypothetical protein
LTLTGTDVTGKKKARRRGEDRQEAKPRQTVEWLTPAIRALDITQPLCKKNVRRFIFPWEEL